MESSCFNLLVKYLVSQNKTEVKLSLDKIESIIQEKLPKSAYDHGAWWFSSGPKDHAAIYICQNAGWFAKPIPSKNVKEVLFTNDKQESIVAVRNEKVSRKMQRREDIPTPSVVEVQKYLDKWNSLGSYVVQEEALDDLYLKTYPSNTDIKQVIIKVSALNDFYSTNIFKVYPVAQHIIDLKIDERIEKNDVTLVNDIANVKVIEQTEDKKEKYINFYSFATKYCSRHNPTEYPIFDSYVEKLLKYFRDTEQKISFKNNDLKNYSKYKNILLDFQKQYGLEQFNLKQIDKYLWQLGKEKFPKNYGKKKGNENGIN